MSRPPLPSDLSNPWIWSAKAALATALALALDELSGNPDHVTSTFVAVLTISPTVLMGMRRALAQVIGSGLGGLFGTIAVLTGAPLLIGIPLAVAAAMLGALGLGQALGLQAAAFTALFLQLVPRGGPLATFGVRLLAVGTAALAGLMVNLLVSSMFYRSLFRRRLAKAEGIVAMLLERARHEGGSVVQPGLAVLATLAVEIGSARAELRMRRSRQTPVLDEIGSKVRRLEATLFAALAIELWVENHCDESAGAGLIAAALDGKELPSELGEISEPLRNWC